MTAPINPLFAYLSILSVVQPARIQDIEAAAEQVLGPKLAKPLLEGDLLRAAHSRARAEQFVVMVRRGVYFTTSKARHIVRSSGLEYSIDNSRFFLMKAQRKKYR